MLKRIFSLSNGALLVALSLSTIAAWYSIIGLTAIFAGAVVPIIIMGTALEFAKITTTVWLRKYWYRCSWVMKVYLVPAVVLLALLTSMGIFGFLSKAHLDQNIGSGDVQAQVSLLDEKIATQRENIRSSKSMLAQMDQQVNDIMTKGDSEKAVERSVTIRKQQAKERASLQKDIEVANKEIAKLNEERAPIASELRKVEAEVGPIKYIAALIYGDNADANMLEAAVRWVIILLVVVFDPLAIMLVLAANQSKEWDKHIDEEEDLREEIAHDHVMEEIVAEEPKYEQDDGPLTEDQIEQIRDATDLTLEKLEVTSEEEEAFKALEPKPEPEKTMAELHPYLNEPFTHFTNTSPLVASKPLQDDGVNEEQFLEDFDANLAKGHEIESPILTLGIDDVERPGDYVTEPVEETVEEVVDDTPPFEGVKVNGEWVQTGRAFAESEIIGTGGKKAHGTAGVKVYKGDEYLEFEGKRMSVQALQGLRPDLFSIQEDGLRMPKTDFGTLFPTIALQGDTFVRVDTVPNRVFKFNGMNWIEKARETTETYLSNDAYMQYLVNKISTGEYDPELLTDAEQEAIKEFISKKG